MPTVTAHGPTPDFAAQREAMLREQILARGVDDARVLAAMREVPREDFVPDYQRRYAYVDSALSIGEGQTISQPFIVAYMLAALELTATDRVLEIGTGSGYNAALCAELAAEVYSVERLPELASRATTQLRRHGYHNVQVHLGDGSLGWPEAAPYDAIVVTAGAPDVPEALQQQLAEGGRLVIPVGRSGSQRLVRVRREGEHSTRELLTPVRFVPLIGKEGWFDDEIW